MWEELENALAWFKAAPANWIKSAKQDLAAAAEWIWTVLQGDFADEQSTAQVVTGTVISMIPFVDQICDVRDLVANCLKINEDTSNKLAWLALVFTLLGLIPVLGSLAKGCLKIVFAAARKALFKGAVKSLDSALWKATAPWVDAGLRTMNQHLQSPAVKRVLKAMKISNPHKWLALKVRELKGAVSASKLTSAFDELLDILKQLSDLMRKWGSAALQTRVGQMLKKVQDVRNQLNAHLGELLKPVQDWLDRLARRLDVEADLAYRAQTNVVNAHNALNANRMKDADEAAELSRQKQPWVDVRKKPVWTQVKITDAKIKAYVDDRVANGWSDPRVKSGPMRDAHTTFHNLHAAEIPPGTVLYRIVDPSSYDNSICWMTKAEFDKLQSKAQWRRYFAVWKHWNSNGEFVTYTVPPGKPLKVWEGVTASQQILNTQHFLEGGARQIVIDPNNLEKSMMGKRQPTGWGTDDGFATEPNFTGLPDLTNNWKQ